MQKARRMRIALDMTMMLLSIALMGGTMLFPDECVHQVLGMALLAMWAGECQKPVLVYSWIFLPARSRKRISCPSAPERIRLNKQLS